MRHRTYAWLLLAVAILSYGWTQVWMAWHGINSNDFKHIYLGMKALLDGISPYSFQALHHQAALQGYRQISLNPYVYLPFTGQAMAFLAPFSLTQAAGAWFVINHLLMAGTIYLLSSLWPSRRLLAAGFLVLAMAISFPLYRTLTAGQLNLALLFLIVLAWYNARRSRERSAGALLAFATLFKLMPGIYALQFLLRRQWKLFSAMEISVMVLLFASMTWAGVKTYLQFIPISSQMAYGKSTWPEVFSFWDDPPNQSLNSFFTHILAANDHTTPWLPLGQPAANSATVAATGLLLAVYCAVVYMASIRPKTQATTPSSEAPVSFVPDVEADVQPEWGATLIMGLLIPSLMWDHYLVMLIFPVALLIKGSRYFQSGAVRGVVILLYLAIAIPWNFENTAWQSGAGVIAMSFKLWPALALFGLILCFTWQQRQLREHKALNARTLLPEPGPGSHHD